MGEAFRMLGSVARFHFLSVFLIVTFSSCKDNGVQRKEGQEQMPLRTIEEVLQEHTDALMSIEGVVGTAIGECDGKPCIKVYVVKKTRELEEQIPATLEGYPVSIQETGEIKALDDGG